MRWLLIHLVLVYRVTLGRLLGGQCRYVPTCSQYAIDAINKHGPWRGGWRAIKRICRCHPWGGQGYDPALRARRCAGAKVTCMGAHAYVERIKPHLLRN
jgi:putative membrane protein insertion efficiency factor